MSNSIKKIKNIAYNVIIEDINIVRNILSQNDLLSKIFRIRFVNLDYFNSLNKYNTKEYKNVKYEIINKILYIAIDSLSMLNKKKIINIIKCYKNCSNLFVQDCKFIIDNLSREKRINLILANISRIVANWDQKNESFNDDSIVLLSLFNEFTRNNNKIHKTSIPFTKLPDNNKLIIKIKEKLKEWNVTYYSSFLTHGKSIININFVSDT